jgi:Tol biopolymer transport system component
VFTRYGAGDFGNSALFTVDVPGLHERQLASFAIGAGHADWALDGRKIVFEAYPGATSTGNVDVIPSRGGRVIQLRHNGSADPVWSPDGTRILFFTPARRTASSSSAWPR